MNLESSLRSLDADRRLVEYRAERLVARARADGWSWRRIAKAMGASHQSVHQQYRHVDGALEETA